jgi:hypothetical protein
VGYRLRLAGRAARARTRDYGSLRSQSVGDGLHAAGCFYGGPKGEGYWFAVEGCPLDHSGDLEPLVAPAENARAALEHLERAGLTVTGESARG